ncbi:MAG: GerAB/ArcD/ProY family transporter [Clostridia bacterium]|nr:GerAB/ArcD/ProY family transporter [Clostridia bacterium]MDE7079225.1 GerAB/ArcD/ProY family transporter [Clostridia bacterium]
MQNKLNNKIYNEQFLLLAFISLITFKVVMLPQYLVKTAGSQSYMTMFFMIAIEIMMLCVVYGITKNGSILQLDIPKWVKGVFAILVFASSLIKSTILGSEGVAYISTSLYGSVSWSFVTLALIIVSLYLAHKGGKVLGRTVQIFFWVLIFALVFYGVFSNFNFEAINLMPFKISSDLAVAGDKFLMWFGDFTPLLFMSTSPSSNRKKSTMAIWITFAVIATLICSVGLMIQFICIFGASGAVVGNAFLNVSSLNKISFMIGSVDLPTVLSWLIMCVIKFALLLYAMAECAKFFFGNKILVSLACGIIVYAVIVYGIGNLKTSYNLATSWLRYFAFLTEFLVTVAAYIAMRVSMNKKQKAPAPQAVNNQGEAYEKA